MLKPWGKRSQRRQNHPRHVLALLNSLKTGGIRKGLPESGSAGRPAELRGRLSCSFYLAPGCQNNNALENEFIPSSELPACATRRCKTTPAAGETPERVFPEGSTSCPDPTDDARMRSCLERTSGSGLGQIRLLFAQCWIIRDVPQPPRPAELTPGVAPPGLHFAGQSTETRGYLSG